MTALGKRRLTVTWLIGQEKITGKRILSKSVICCESFSNVLVMATFVFFCPYPAARFTKYSNSFTHIVLGIRSG